MKTNPNPIRGKKKEVFAITLGYRGKKYVIKESWKENYGWDTKLEGINYMFEEGNYSCDCNKSRFIKRQVDPKFKEMDCGGKIKLIGIETL